MEIEKRIAALENEIDRLKAEMRNQKISLPLEITDDGGNRVLKIACGPHDNSLTFYDKKGQAVLSIGADGLGGYIGVKNSAGKVVCKLDVETYGGRLELLDSCWDSQACLVAHGNDCDNDGGWLKVLSSEGEGEVSICIEEGSGKMTLVDQSGKEKAITPEHITPE